VVGSCEHGNEPSGSIRYLEILKQLGNCWLLKKRPQFKGVSHYYYYFINTIIIIVIIILEIIINLLSFYRLSCFVSCSLAIFVYFYILVLTL
jgi:hypothetical protein